MNRRILLFLLPGFLFLMQCMPVEEKKMVEINLDLQDPQLQKIYDLQDRQIVDSLFLYFHQKNPAYRYAAAMTFGSILGEKAEKGVDSLVVLLQDEVTGVRLGAAYALGQIGSTKSEEALIKAFRDTLINSNYLRKTILEAVGKSASPRFLPALSTTKTYLRTDTLLLEGQAYGIYRYALRDIVSQEGTDRMSSFLIKNNYPSSVRLIAANYLQRAKNISIDSFALDLVKVFRREKEENTRMALALGLGKSKKAGVRDALLQQYEQEEDYRVKCNIIRALSNSDYLPVQALVLAALNDANPHVSSTAARFLTTSGTPADATAYWRKAKDDTTLHWQTRMELYTAANKLLPHYFEVTKGRINQELRNIFTESVNPYEQGATLKALAEFGWNYRFIKEQGFTSTTPVIKTSCMEALAKIVRNPNFKRFFGLGHRKVKRDMAEYYKEAIQTNDPGMMAEAALVLADPQLDFKSVIEDFSYLQIAQQKLRLPQEIETWNSMQKAIDYFKGTEPEEARKPAYNHPIDWRIVGEVNADTRAVLQVGEDEISLQFFPDAAPGSVANFIRLARNGYFNGKNFHRVVSNFVAQGGCPRGDGYGGLNYSIRSELPQMYYNEEGFVGMASSGVHTESTQFFITHSPTLHLDGRYTIFAKVDKGMDVVHKLEVGAIIDHVSIRN